MPLKKEKMSRSSKIGNMSLFEYIVLVMIGILLFIGVYAAVRIVMKVILNVETQ